MALTYQGLRALGVPPASLDSFAPEFRQGMAARAAELGDVGESSPAAWESPLGSSDVHVALAVLSPDAARLCGLAGEGPPTYQELGGVEVIWRQDCYQLPTGRTSFGFKDGIGQPAIEGSGVPGTNPMERPIKAGEFILGYPDETGCSSAAAVARDTRPERYVHRLSETPHARRRLPSVPARQCSEPAGGDAAGSEDGGPLAEWRPSALRPDSDDPDSGADPEQNNLFLYADDLGGFKCPAGAHVRRANPRDSLDGDGNVNVRLHRMIRRGTSYGPPLPEGALDDDGADRGIVFVFAGAHLDRQFEFVKTQWLNDGVFIWRIRGEGSPRRLGRWQRPIQHSAAAHSPPPTGHPTLCGHPGRRVLLRSGDSGPRLARRTRDLAIASHPLALRRHAK